MSQSSETTKINRLLYLSYPDQHIMNGYYTARVAPGLGVTVCEMVGGCAIIQFFPWLEDGGIGHEVYAKWITDRASQIMASNGVLFVRWPFLTTQSDDLLMIKCLIEEGIQEVERQNASHQSGTVNGAAGEAVE